MFDTERSGYIAVEQFRKVPIRAPAPQLTPCQAMLAYGEPISASAVDDMVAAADTNRDGFIHYEVFVDMVFQAAPANILLDL